MLEDSVANQSPNVPAYQHPMPSRMRSDHVLHTERVAARAKLMCELAPKRRIERRHIDKRRGRYGQRFDGVPSNGADRHSERSRDSPEGLSSVAAASDLLPDRY